MCCLSEYAPAHTPTSLNFNIRKHEHKLHKLNKRALIRYNGNKLLDRVFFVENCYLGIANTYYKEHGPVSSVEEASIDLRKVEDLSQLLVKKTYWGIRFQGDLNSDSLPLLYFESSAKVERAYKVLKDLVPLCQKKAEKESGFLNSVTSPGRLEVPHSEDPFAREIHYFEDDPTMRAALLDAKMSYTNRLRLAKEAEKQGDSLLVQTLIFMADEAGIRVADELIRKVQNGVRVEVLMDALSSTLDIRNPTVHANTKRMYRNLMAAGIPVYGYRCRGHHLWDEFKLGTHLHSFILNQRPHEKLWIVNEKKAILGGMNIGNDYFGLNKPGPHYWRDQDILVEGDKILQDMMNIFEANALTYKQNYLDPRKDSCFNPHDPITEKKAYRAFYKAHVKSYQTRKDVYPLSMVLKMEREVHDEASEFSPDFEDISAMRVVHNRPKLNELLIEDVYIELINNSSEEILIENAYLIPSPPVVRALLQAARRGVDIKIITNGYETNDIPPVAVFARHKYKELVDANLGGDGKDGRPREIEIWEWTGSNSLGVQEQGMNHSKFMVVDRKLLFVGSYNLDPRSREINSEIGVVLEGKQSKLARALAEEFLNTDLSLCKRVHYREILDYRKPIGLAKAMFLKGRGFRLEPSLWQISKEDFFFRIANYKKNIW